MRLNPGLIVTTLLPGMVLFGLPAHGFSQTRGSRAGGTATKPLPNAPQPQSGHGDGPATDSIPLSFVATWKASLGPGGGGWAPALTAR